MKLLFVIPNFNWCDHDENTAWHFVPYGIGILMSVMRDVCEIELLDANIDDLNEEEFMAKLSEINPDIAGISVLTDVYAESGHTAAKLIKTFRKKIIVLMGGVYATTNPNEIIKDENIDYVFMGEGEVVLKEFVIYCMNEGPMPHDGICYRQNGEIVNLGRAKLIENLDYLPIPAYDLINYNKYYTNISRNSVDRPLILPYAGIITSRGCPWNCAFCQVETIAGRKFRARSADNILKELQYLKKTYDVKSILFYDDNLFTDRKRASDIFHGMIEMNLNLPWKSLATAVFRLDKELINLMAMSGCQYIDIAIESGTERIRDFIGKPIDFEKSKEIVKYARESGIYVAANFIIGFPGETWDEIRQTIKYAEELKVDYIKLFNAVPLPNTRLWNICKERRLFKKGFEKVKNRWGSGQILSNEYSINSLSILRAYEWERINFDTEEKRIKTAEIMGITVDELNTIRQKTLREVFNKLEN